MGNTKHALGYEDGRTYYCGYWDKVHTVRVLREGGPYDGLVESTWSDGRTTQHMTAFDPRHDCIIPDTQEVTQS